MHRWQPAGSLHVQPRSASLARAYLSDSGIAEEAGFAEEQTRELDCGIRVALQTTVAALAAGTGIALRPEGCIEGS